MPVEAKPGMYCERCQKPVAAQRYVPRGAIFWGGLIGKESSSSDWSCPDCGGPVVEAATPQGWHDDQERPGWLRYWNGKAWTEQHKLASKPPGCGSRR